MAHIRVRAWHYALGVVVVALVVLMAVWNWDWFVPRVERMAAARLGRPVRIEHLHVHLARNPLLEADGVVIANPQGFPVAGPFARIARLEITVNGPQWLGGNGLALPTIAVNGADVAAVALPDGRNNWTFPFSGLPSGKQGSSARIGNLRILDSHVHVVDPLVKSDFNVDIATRAAQAGRPEALVADAHGTYAGQPITARFVGGALLTLRNKSDPYPLDLALANGATRAVLRGTVTDPMAFAGTNLKIELSGQSLSNLMPLSGVAAPETPPYRLSADLAYADRRFRLDHIVGRIGNSDLSGSIDMAPGTERPQVTADLRSRELDLADFSGFLGATPGRATNPGQTPEQRAEIARAGASPYLVPRTPLALPRLHAADVTVQYRGERIVGKSMPFDNLAADLTVKDGAIRLHPLSIGVGRGRIVTNLAADETAAHELRVQVDTDFRQVDVARLLSATHRFGGAGTIGGAATLEGAGTSVHGIVAGGNGELKLFMTGGDISALLVDLSGLEFGNALLSSLGMPKRTPVRCLVADLALRRGILDTRTLVLDTQAADVTGKGSINFRDEVIDYQLRTQAKHFSIGSLPTPIDITGHLARPSVGPAAKDLAIRGGLAAALGVLLTPLAALLPTIQLGLGKDNDCATLIHNAANTPNPATPGEATR